MRQTLIAVVMLLALTACDKQLSKQLVRSTQHEDTVECDDGPAGVCGKYDWTYKGKLKYWYGLHLHCPGHQKVTVQLDDFRTTYQKSDGSTYTEDSQDRTIVQRLTACQ